MLPSMSGKSHIFTLELRRSSPSEQWGFSLVGGADQNAPLIITRVGFHSPVAHTIQRGDVIKKIGNYDARDIRHQDAQNLFKNAGTNIKVVVSRESNAHNTSTASSLCNTPMSMSPALSPRGPVGLPMSAPLSPALPHSNPDHFTNLTEGYFKELYPHDKKRHEHDDDIENVINQPYRTTPLVLPGAKIKREPGPTESYLRHHPNPNVRSPPHSYDHEHFMKQRVADSVIQKVVAEVPHQSNLQISHKQFNSPIQLYTEQNIADTIRHQSGITTANGTYVPKGKIISKKYDPLLSETYKAIQEEENDMLDVSPIAPKVFTPPGPRHPPQPKKQIIHHPPPHSPPHHLNSIGVPADAIQQSGSFKRLMFNVMMNSDM